MNYNAGQTNRTDYQAPMFEEKYQKALYEVLRRVEGGPFLMKPRERIRGWAWRGYHPQKKEN